MTKGFLRAALLLMLSFAAVGGIMTSAVGPAQANGAGIDPNGAP